MHTLVITLLILGVLMVAFGGMRAVGGFHHSGIAVFAIGALILVTLKIGGWAEFSNRAEITPQATSTFALHSGRIGIQYSKKP